MSTATTESGGEVPGNLLQTIRSAATALRDSIVCPVCWNVFSGPIFLCRIGHSVCNFCFVQIKQCPTCRSPMDGVLRNYALEDVVHRLHQQTMASLGSGTLRRNGTQRTILPESGVFLHSATKHLNLTPFVCVHILDDALPRIRRISPPQSRGLFTCRSSTGCTERLPICRMFNHIRQCHADAYVCSNIDLQKRVQAPLLWPDAVAWEPRFTMRWIVTLQRSMRRAVHIRRAGLFFVCFDRIAAAPTKTGGEPTPPTHFAWVQAACTNAEARRFKFRFDLTYGPQNTVATYEDACFGETWTEHAIRSARYCLAVRLPDALSRATLRVHICEHIDTTSTVPAVGPLVVARPRRSKQTTITVGKASSQSTQRNDDGAADVGGRRRNRRRKMPPPMNSSS